MYTINWRVAGAQFDIDTFLFRQLSPARRYYILVDRVAADIRG